MLLFVVGVILGALALGLVTSFSYRRRLRTLRRQRALLQATLHSLLMLAERAARQLDDPDLRTYLAETRAQLTADGLFPEGGGTGPARPAPSGTGEPSGDDVPPIFPRHPS